MTTNGFNSRNRTHKSRVGTDTTSDKIIEIEQKEVIAPVRNQVYLSNTEGQGYGQDTKRFGSNAGAEGGARSSMPSDSWAALMAKGDQVVVTTKIDVDSRSPPTSPRVFDASKALRTMGEATITPGERPPRKHDSAGGMTFYNPRDSMA